jgi:hypothetical protein
MTNDQVLDSAVRSLLREPAATRTGGLHRALGRVGTTPQRRRRWWPFGMIHSKPDTEGSMTFSALKFVVAGVIVALFGGFLVAGVLTTQQDGEAPPAAVTASPAAEATSDPTEAPEPSVRTDILPGVTLNLEQVEPGIVRVIDDGVRDLAKANNLDIVAGHDDGIWLLRPRWFFSLGGDTPRAWPITFEGAPDLEVAPDGTVWAMLEPHSAWPRFRLYSVARASDAWTLTRLGVRLFELTSDGTVWALWRAGPEDPDGMVFGYLGADGWQSVGEWLFGYERWTGPGDLLVSDGGEVWAFVWGDGVRRFVDGAWRSYDGRPDFTEDIAVGADGTFWGITGRGVFFRFDGSEWMTFEPPDWMPKDARRGGRHPWGRLRVAPDDALWVPVRGKVHDRLVIDGVARFDGVTWSHYLQGFWVEAMDIAADGAIWLLATEPDADIRHVYVITPEAVSAKE